MRNFKQDGSALCKGMRKGDDKCARILRKNHHISKAMGTRCRPARSLCLPCPTFAWLYARIQSLLELFRGFPAKFIFRIFFSYFVNLWSCVVFWNCAVIYLWIFMYMMCCLFYFSGILDIFVPTLLLDW